LMFFFLFFLHSVITDAANAIQSSPTPEIPHCQHTNKCRAC
jgi:hypothetical protein